MKPKHSLFSTALQYLRPKINITCKCQKSELARKEDSAGTICQVIKSLNKQS